jgi:glycosyltransferase involved in cell wall biosynthesis
VKHGETGLLVTERDPVGLATALLELLENDELWQRYSAAGRTRVVAQFNLLQQTERLEKRFCTIAGRKVTKWRNWLRC